MERSLHMISGQSELEKEKSLRIGYQLIVYEICTLVDKKLGYTQRYTTIDQLVPTLEKLLQP